MSGSGEELVEVRDRRELPFFQVHLAAVRAIRVAASGPRLVRAIGLYALLCQLANEQRHSGEHRVVRASYDTLVARGQAGRSSVKALLDTLARAGVVRCERVNDPARGATVSLLHLQIHEGGWTAVTVAMAEHLASERTGGRLLRDLGLVVVLLELCCEQRAEHGGLSAATTRGVIAERVGLTLDRVDGCNKILERAGVLSIERRRVANGGRHLPSTYTLHEAPCRRQAGASGLAGPQTGTGRAVDQDWQGGISGLAGPQTGTGRAADQDWQGGISATVGPDLRPSIARPRERAVEKAVETLSPSAERRMKGGGDRDLAASELCEALVSAWEPALGENPRRCYLADRQRWLAAAAELLERHPRGRLQHALDYMLGDEILGSRALSMPGFSKVADQLLARHHARARRTSTSTAAAPAGVMGWPAARELLERAAQRYGRDDRRGALAELAGHSELLVVFVERVRWSALCEQQMRYSDGRNAQIWNGLLHDHATNGVEVAA